MTFRKNYTDEELVAACAANDRLAQEALYRRFFQEMYNMCRRYSKDEDAIIEMVNNGFLRVFKKIHTFEFRGSLEGWVRRLVYHSMADYFKNNARYINFLVLEEHDQGVPENGHDKFFEEDILTAVRALPPLIQEVFRLYAIEGFTHAEIAEQLRLSEGTSKWYLNKARENLKTALRRLSEYSHIERAAFGHL